MTIAIQRLQSRPAWLVANLCLWLVLVAFFTQSIALWHLLVAGVGSVGAGAAPILLSALLAVAAAGYVWRRRRGISWLWVALSVAVFALGLATTDADFPAKRVHMPQYFLLALVAFWSCRAHVRLGTAVWGAVLLAAMLGGIDEVLQGAMPTRTFGLRDIVTNGLGALSAGFFLMAITRRDREDGVAIGLAALSCAGAFALLMLAANAHKGAALPPWAYLPALASLPLLAVYGRTSGGRLEMAVAAVCLLGMLLLFGIDALDFDFR